LILYEDEKESPLDVVGEIILQRIMLRDPSEGGVFFEVTGSQGSGKTSLIFNLVKKIMEVNPEELVFMRDSIQSPVQFNRFPRWRIMAEDGLKIAFRDIVHNKLLNIPVTRFRDYDDLYSNAKPNTINAVYFNEERKQWFEFINYLRRATHRINHSYLRQDTEEPVWKTVIWDEYEDLCPDNEPKPVWTWIKNFKDEVKNIRKGLVSFLVNTQNKWDVDHRIRGKIMIRAYLKGAKVDKNSPIDQPAVNVLEEVDGKRQAMLDWDARYGKIRFNPYPPKNPLFEVVIKN